MAGMQPHPIATWDDLEIDAPTGVLVSNVDLVVVRYGEASDDHSVLYGRCLHRGVKLADGHVDGPNLICGVHGWDYRKDTGVSSYDNDEALHRFTSWVDDGRLFVDLDEIEQWEQDNPQPYDRRRLPRRVRRRPHGAPEEPFVGEIQAWPPGAAGSHGPVAAMGVPREQLPSWDSIQFVTAQLARKPLLDDAEVDTETVIGPAPTSRCGSTSRCSCPT
jgi:nitrite reductase/ring-hydroxylating ferredoxin subunit